MTTIWKYKLDKPKQTIHLPDGAKVIHVHGQHDAPTIWALIDTEEPLFPRTFAVYGTGVEMEFVQRREYCGTAHLADGMFGIVVLHVFEEA